MKVIFFQKKQLTADNSIKNPQFACIDNCFISKSLRPMFLVTGGTALIFVYHQNGKNLAKSWSSARRARESAHKFYSIRFYIDVSTFELSLIRFKIRPPFEKIAFNFRYVTLCTFRSLVGCMLESP